MMTLRTIAIKNIARRKGKMALIVFGLALAVATLVSVVSIIQAFQGTVDKKLDQYGFSIVVFPKSKQVLIKYGPMTLGTVSSYRAPALTRDDLGRLARVGKQTGLMRGFSPKLLDVAEVDGKRVLLAGIYFKAERRIKKWWLVENGRYPVREDEVFIGQTAAEKLGLEVGEKIAVRDRAMNIVGILMETGSQDDELVFTDLAGLTAAAGKGDQVSLVEVAAKRSEDGGALGKAIRPALPQ